MNTKIYRLTARILFSLWLGLTLAAIGNNSFLLAAGKKNKLEGVYEEFYRYARYLFTKNERKIYKNLPDNKSRDEFIKYFWEIRDPNPYTKENEFKVEIQRRYEYVNRYLKEGPVPGWKTDRGRIYILLGPPTNYYEQMMGNGFSREIWWYYVESEIYVRFVDPNGNGLFRMDLRNTSLRLLDEMEMRKYYIVNKEEKDEFFTEIMDFRLKYDKPSQEIVIDVDTRHLSYEKDTESGENSDMMVAKVKVNLVIYEKNTRFSRFTKVITRKFKQEELLGNKKKMTLRIPLKLPKGKLKIDAIISDFLGDAVQRKFVKIKN